MSIKPVAWINADNTCAGISTESTEYGPNRKPLIPAIPDTHRVVPVDLLQEAVEQVSELKTFAAIRAIIEDKP